MTKQYSELSTLFCGYFNQDWDEDYSTPEAVITAFANNGSIDRIKATIDELEVLLQENHKKEEWLLIIYDDFGCFCNPEADGLHSKEWLKKVKKQLEDELELAVRKSSEQKSQI